MLNRETAIFKRTYAEDMALYPAPLPRYTILVLLFLFFVVVPLTASEYTLGVANLLGIASFGALGLNLLVGYTGQISIGHAAFMSVGAYTSAMLVSIVGVHWGLAMIAGGLVAMFIGLLVGIPSLRIKGLYLAISTLAAQLIIEWSINHMPFIPGGAGGSIYMDKPSIFGYQLKTNLSFYFFIYIVLVVGLLFAMNLFRTHLGRSMIAVRDRDIAAEIIGINIFKTKLTAFGIASFYAGITGVLYTYYFGVANYEAFTLVVSIQFLAMIIIGGLGSIMGSVFGAVFISLLPILLDIFLRSVGATFMEESEIAAVTTQLQLMLYGGLIMLFLVVEPDGLRKMWRNITDYFKVWPFPYL